jgi:hypothetical protein
LGYYDPDTDDWEVASYSPRRSQQVVVTKKPFIQGLSSLLVDRQLVLITTENEILDILTSSQQQEIRRRIGIDLAVEWYQWSTGEVLDRHSPEQLALDRAAAQLAISSGEDRAPNLFDRVASPMVNRWQNWLKNLTTKSESAIVPSSNFTTEQFDRSEQIEPNLPRQIAPASYTFNPQPPSIERFLGLPQLPPIYESESLVVQDHPIQSAFTKLQPEWLKQWWHYYREYLSIPATDFDEFESSQLIHQPEEFQLTRLDQPIDGIERVTSSDRVAISKTIQKSESTHNQRQLQQHSGKLDRKVFQNVEFDPDWIETAAEQVGYSRSPIIQLLEWIDRLFLQIENWVINIWEKMTNSSNQS